MLSGKRPSARKMGKRNAGNLFHKTHILVLPGVPVSYILKTITIDGGSSGQDNQMLLVRLVWTV